MPLNVLNSEWKDISNDHALDEDSLYILHMG